MFGSCKISGTMQMKEKYKRKEVKENKKYI